MAAGTPSFLSSTATSSGMGDYDKDVRRVDELNELATRVYEQHQRLVATARRRLGA